MFVGVWNGAAACSGFVRLMDWRSCVVRALGALTRRDVDKWAPLAEFLLGRRSCRVDSQPISGPRLRAAATRLIFRPRFLSQNTCFIPQRTGSAPVLATLDLRRQQFPQFFFLLGTFHVYLKVIMPIDVSVLQIFGRRTVTLKCGSSVTGSYKILRHCRFALIV